MIQAKYLKFAGEFWEDFMVSYKLKENLFQEKIATVRIAHQGSYSLLQTANTIDFLPANLQLYVEVDFFNIHSDRDYTLIVNLIKKNLDAIPAYTTRVNIPARHLTYKMGGLGKTQGNFDFNIVIEEEGDYVFYFSFNDENNQSLDTYYQYISIIKE